ncbi:coiled-coil-helix-coiled-coil-helix domain-containing protein 2-like [Lycorma delicatula]|uniref:coiled-coil-helix-coiled-coil-helix domain-containing protein 2-like n=1 Tax=Lycorma delicatula TaxID=130591 RepID=UPI003F515A74
MTRKGSSESSKAEVPPSQPAPVQNQVEVQEQPGILKQMAATAGSVALGSAVGHSVGQMLTGLFNRFRSEKAPDQPISSGTTTLEPTNPCAMEIKQFLKCAEEKSDNLALCEKFREAFLQCKATHRIT